MGTLGSLINTGTGTAFNQKGGIVLEICKERREEGQQPLHQEINIMDKKLVIEPRCST